MEKVNQNKLYYNIWLEDVKNWKIPKSQKDDVLKFFKDFEIGKITDRISSKRTMEHYIIYLKIALNFLNKEVKDLTEENIDDFSHGLLNDKIKSIKNKVLSNSVKQKIKRTLLQFIKWKDFKKAGEIIKSLEVKIKQGKTEPDFMDEDEIDKLYKNSKNAEERYLIAVLFSSGARLSEFLNIRFNDIEMPKEKENFAKVTLKVEFSKTKGRTIPLFYKNALEAVSEFLEIRKKEGIKDNEPVWKMGENTTKKRLNSFGVIIVNRKMKDGTRKRVEVGRKILDRHIHTHLFRSSCATWIATRLNDNEMYYFFGWLFGSPVANKYISRSGIKMKEATEKFTQTEMSELKAKLSKQNIDNKLRSEELEKIKKEMQMLKHIVLKGNKEQEQIYILSNDSSKLKDIKFNKDGTIKKKIKIKN